MAQKLTLPDRREKAERAFHLAIRRVSYTKIGEALGISRQLASTLVKEEQARRTTEREKDEERSKAIATYEWVIESAAKQLAVTQANSLNISGLHNNIIAAQKCIDDITGVRAPVSTEERIDISYRDFSTAPELDQLFSLNGEFEEASRGYLSANSEESIHTDNTHR